MQSDRLKESLLLTWFKFARRARGAITNAASEDRTHDLRIMRPTRYQLRYSRVLSAAAPQAEQFGSAVCTAVLY